MCIEISWQHGFFPAIKNHINIRANYCILKCGNEQPLSYSIYIFTHLTSSAQIYWHRNQNKMGKAQFAVVSIGYHLATATGNHFLKQARSPIACARYCGANPSLYVLTN